MKLSIIVPVYNVEFYLKKCLSSIKEQDLSVEEYEVIIINDGSLDNSQIIIDEFCSKYENFHSFFKENGGLSSARNYGIDKAKGEYLFFVDSDDFLVENSLNKVLDRVYKSKVDCIAFDYQKVSRLGQLIPKKAYYKDRFEVSADYFLNNNTLVPNATSYLFKREVVLDNKLKFIHGIFHEDEDFTLRFISYSQKIKYIDIIVYNYLQREDSIMLTLDKDINIKKIFDMITVIESINNRKRETSGLLYIGIAKRVELLLISIFLRMRAIKLKYNDVRDVIKQLEELDLYPLRIKHQNIKFKFVSFFFNSNLFCRFYFGI